MTSKETQLTIKVLEYMNKNKLGEPWLNDYSEEWNVEDHPELHQYMQKLVSIRRERSEKRRNKMNRYIDQRLNTFAEVEEMYDSVKPVVSKNHTVEQDIRPVGARHRKHERIMKINDNKYLINDGTWDSIAWWSWYDTSITDPTSKQYYVPHVPTANEIEKLAPIMWYRKNGKEYLRVRNGSGNGGHQGRYCFLECTLPSDLMFFVSNGKQYVCNINREVIDNHSKEAGSVEDGTHGVWIEWGEIWKHLEDHPECKYFLPKSDYNPACKHVYYPNDNEHGMNRWNAWGMDRDDNKYLLFERQVDKSGEHLGWKIAGNSFTFESPRTQVNKTRKARIKPHMDKFYEYIMTMYPLLDCGLGADGEGHVNWHVYQDRQAILTEHYTRWQNPNATEEEINTIKDHSYHWDWKGKSKFIEHVITKQSHEARPTLVEMFVLDSDLRHIKMGDIDLGLTEQQLKSKVRSQYNRWINKILELVSTVSEKKVVTHYQKEVA
jgi:hypothetical protein